MMNPNAKYVAAHWEERKLPFEVKLSVLAALLLFVPMLLCIMLELKPSVSYWFGNWMLIVALALPLWVVACYILLITERLTRKNAPAWMVIIPALVLVAVVQKQAWTLAQVQVELQAQDCDTWPRKKDLDRSWEAARDFRDSCLQAMAKEQGVPPRELENREFFEDCDGYDDYASSHSFKRDWEYLEALEKHYYCGGWCTPQDPLWISKEGVADSCSLAAYRAISGNIRRMSVQATVYGGIILTGSVLILTFYPQALSVEF